MNILKVLSFFIVLARSQLFVGIFYSSFTDQAFVQNLTLYLKQNFQYQFEFSLIYFGNNLSLQGPKSSPNIILDATFSPSLSESLKEYAKENHAIIANVDKAFGGNSNSIFFTHNSMESHFYALSSVIAYLNWQTFIVISSEIYDGLLNNILGKNCQWFYFPDSNDKRSADLFIGKIIQTTGIRNIVILNNGNGATILLKSLGDHGFLTNTTGIIVGSEGSWGLYGNGIIAYAESGLENANSHFSYQCLAIQKFLNLILECPSAYDPLALLDFLDKNTDNHHPISNFTLLNVKNSKKIIVGNIFNGNLMISSPLIFPGNSTIIPNSPTTNINIWIADGSTNPGTDPDYLATSVTSGEFYALAYWKSIHVLDGFEITVTNTDCGATVFDKTYAYSCFAKLLKTPGVGYLTSLYPYISIGYIYTLRALNCSIPSISPYAPSTISRSQASFPEFMTVIKDEKFYTQVILSLALVFGWKNFIVTYDDANKDAYEYFVANVEQFNMKITNPPIYRKIDTYYTKADFEKWRWWFEGLINVKTRIAVSFLTPPYGFYVAETLYDLGVRRGGAFHLSNAKMAYTVEWEKDPVERQKLIELFYGSIIVTQVEWFGEYGKMLKNGYVKAYGNQTDFCCWAFDAAMLLLNGIEYTIKQGENVKNNQIMNANLRKQKFLGCSGTISIEPGGNQRSVPTIGIYSLRWDDKLQKLYEEFVGVYDVSSVQLFTFYSSIVWYDNTTNVPTDTKIYANGCSFPPSKISRSEKGAGVLYGITACIMIISAIEAFFIWKKIGKNIIIKKLVVAARVHFEDYILMGVIAIDFFQFISQGPDISELYSWLSLLCTYSMANFDSTVAGNIYWGYVYTAIGITGYLIISCFILYFRRIEIIGITLRHAISLALLLLPLVGHIIFVPMASVLLSVFQCDQGISSKITDSFIRHDCTVNCWDDQYLIWAIISIISLLAYIPLAIYLRYYYEIVNGHINVRTNPIFIIEKAICQIIIIILNNTVKVYNESLHGLLCCILFLVIILLRLKQSSYNYHRMNLWVIISYLAILWCFILSSIYWLTKFELKILFLALICCGWTFLISVGIAIQCKWYSSLLNTEKVLDIAIFFKFEIGNKITAADLNRMKKEINNSRDSIKKNTPIINSTRMVPTVNENMISESNLQS